ncbi:acetylglutamate kinase [Candidatus Pelagibacter communis]|jgi:acetylglutamate kinase|uniref:acetylglutamate kinase n=1 Tax=Pelagibacter ubique TaxID=198252 RepID=UPI00094C5388|nr:acetylglutamate kinase [Candidatus Pelagibacter ubique]
MDLEKILPKNGPPISEVTKYIEKYKNDLIVIKYGGNVLIDRKIFNNFITDISILNKLSLSVVVVHGGGPRIKRELDKSNIQSKFIRGLRVTDKKIIDIVESVLIDFNIDIVNSLQEKGSEAISLHTKKNNIIHVVPEAHELGFVGIPNKINHDLLLNIIKQNKIPIISPLGLDRNNQTHNINGDTAAMAVAKSLKSRRLLLMTNVDGVLDKEKNLIEEISSSEILKMINDEIITEGMIPKINACLDAVNNGVTAVGIINGTKQHSCLWEIFSDKGSGTLIRK